MTEPEDRMTLLSEIGWTLVFWKCFETGRWGVSSAVRARAWCGDVPKSQPLLASMEFLLCTKQYIALAALIYNNVPLIDKSF